MRVKFGTGTKDVPISEVNAANYIVPKGEEGSWHVIQEIPSYHQRTGKRLSVPRVQKYGVKEFKDMQRLLRQQGYELTILHDPTDYLAKLEEEKAERENLTAEKKRELELKKREAEKAAMKAEILAELKEAGVIPSEDKAGEEKAADKGKSNKGGKK